MLVRPGFEPATFLSADQRSPNWANKVRIKVTGIALAEPIARKKVKLNTLGTAGAYKICYN